LPINKILSVERTRITVSGKLTKKFVQDVFAAVAGSYPVTSVSSSYSQKNNLTTISIRPYYVFTIGLPPEVEKLYGDGISRQRRVVFPGVIIDSKTIINHIVENCWVPVRKVAKHTSDDLRWVVVTPRIVRDDETGHATTEISFFIETYDPKSHDPRGCKPKNIKETLGRAVDVITREMCKIIAADNEDGNLEATHALNEFSATYAEELEKRLMDAEMAEVLS